MNDDWKERRKEAIKTSKDGEHAWFKFKEDEFDSCAKCGTIRSKDNENKRCYGIIKFDLGGINGNFNIQL